MKEVQNTRGQKMAETKKGEVTQTLGIQEKQVIL